MISNIVVLHAHVAMHYRKISTSVYRISNSILGTALPFPLISAFLRLSWLDNRNYVYS